MLNDLTLECMSATCARTHGRNLAANLPVRIATKLSLAKQACQERLRSQAALPRCSRSPYLDPQKLVQTWPKNFKQSPEGNSYVQVRAITPNFTTCYFCLGPILNQAFNLGSIGTLPTCVVLEAMPETNSEVKCVLKLSSGTFDAK